MRGFITAFLSLSRAPFFEDPRGDGACQEITGHEKRKRQSIAALQGIWQKSSLGAFAGSGHAADEAAGAEVFETLADGLAFFAVETLTAEG